MPRTAENPTRLAAWLAAAEADPAATGVLLDFDGTLSPIVAKPEDARPAGGAVEAVTELADVIGSVAIISGRPVGYLAEHLRGVTDKVHLQGLYGLEYSTPEGVQSAPGAEKWRQAVDAAASRAEGEMKGIHVERKGLTVTLHYRSVPDRGPSVEAAAHAVAAELGLVAHPGKMSVELRPPVEVDKGTVVDQMASALSVVAFAGDDMGDLPAYAAIDRIRAEGRTTLSVAAGGPETPQPVLDAADLIVAGPAGVVDLLEQIVSRLRR